MTFNNTGCFSEDQAIVQQDIQLPAADAGEDGTLNCAVSQINLDGTKSANGNGYSYLWETVDGNIVSGASTPTPLVNAAGTYTLTITNETTGCTNLMLHRSSMTTDQQLRSLVIRMSLPSKR